MVQRPCVEGLPFNSEHPLPQPEQLSQATSGSACRQGGTVPRLAVGKASEQAKGRTPRQLNTAAGGRETVVGSWQ